MFYCIFDHINAALVSMRDKPKEKFFVSKQLLYSGLIALPTNTSVKVSVGRV